MPRRWFTAPWSRHWGQITVGDPSYYRVKYRCDLSYVCHPQRPGEAQSTDNAITVSSSNRLFADNYITDVLGRLFLFEFLFLFLLARKFRMGIFLLYKYNNTQLPLGYILPRGSVAAPAQLLSSSLWLRRLTGSGSFLQPVPVAMLTVYTTPTRWSTGLRPLALNVAGSLVLPGFYYI